jgi:hypothetical protein
MGLLIGAAFLVFRPVADGYISAPAAIALFALILGVLTFVDAATVHLVAFVPHKIRLRTAVLVAAAFVAFPVIALPIIFYVNGISASDCRDWGRDLRDGRKQLATCTDPKKRFYVLGETAKAAAQLAKYDEAKAYATELLQLAPSYRKDWNYGNAIHDGHMVLGRVAIARGDHTTAGHELLLAGNSPGSPQLDSFGPNMSLARDLLQSGDREVVYQYFDECGRFWKFGKGPLKRWKALAELHLPPDFGANLLY